MCRRRRVHDFLLPQNSRYDVIEALKEKGALLQRYNFQTEGVFNGPTISNRKKFGHIHRPQTNTVLADKPLSDRVNILAERIVACYKNNGKVLFCGNGGSAADAQHLAAEFSGRYYYDRPPVFAEALHVNTSYLTAVANDYSYEEVYARLVKAMGNKGDILVGLSTSGNSKMSSTP